MKLSAYIVLTILVTSIVFDKIQYNEARQLQTDGEDRDHHFTAGYTDDFGPTSPGNSPGIGHKMKENNDTVKEDFKPTVTPGHGSDVGHAVKNNEPKA
ncbi:hypothetical protein N665_0666s0032 [Sinapis alba]|nr:hypothetical protein N665_0666s0032 [Sinapis alba]